MIFETLFNLLTFPFRLLGRLMGSGMDKIEVGSGGPPLNRSDATVAQAMGLVQGDFVYHPAGNNIDQSWARVCLIRLRKNGQYSYQVAQSRGSARTTAD